MKKIDTIYKMMMILVSFCFVGAYSMSQQDADSVNDESLEGKKTAHVKTPAMIFMQKITKRRPHGFLFNSIAPENQRRLKSLDDVVNVTCEEDVYPEELIKAPRVPTPVLGKAPISDIRHSISCDSALGSLGREKREKNNTDLKSRLSTIPGLLVRQAIVKPLVQTPEEKLKVLFKHLP